MIEPLGESRSNHRLVQELGRRFGLTVPVFRRTHREHMAALLAGATGPTVEISPERVLEGGPVRLNGAGRVPARSFFYSEELERQGLPALPGWAPDPVEAEGGRPFRHGS